ncbi:uncharacterized protein RHO25_012153 [Cercospora beticola]|uniref:Uncharacterized protein n=1 Tax=Cercospora beticola TaxID=122368 RepID=A0ABZ0P6I7_CERBT|nr:hypothetical protein RHO25_012153 [Cercospora beticola]
MINPASPHTETLVVLDFNCELDLENYPAWNKTLQQFFEHGACQGLMWSKVIDRPLQAVMHISWHLDTDPARTELTNGTWIELAPFLQDMPRSQDIKLGIRYFFTTPSLFHELVLITGDPDLVTPECLQSVDWLLERTMPQISGTQSEFLLSCVRGITAPEDSGATRTIATLWAWPSLQRREQFIDPEQDSLGGGTQYHDLFGLTMRRLEGCGATVTKYLLHLQQWRPKKKPEKRQRKCVVL